MKGTDFKEKREQRAKKKKQKACNNKKKNDKNEKGIHKSFTHSTLSWVEGGECRERSGERVMKEKGAEADEEEKEKKRRV